MISVRKLQAMPLGTALRRCLRQMEALERDFPLDSLQQDYLNELLAWLASADTDFDSAVAAFYTAGTDQRYAFFDLRSQLQTFLGMEPAEWDFLPRGQAETSTAIDQTAAEQQGPLAGIRLYLDGIRSPFNLGSIIRSASAFGCRELLLSPLTVSEEHPRCRRSAMGCSLSLRRMSHQDLLKEDVQKALLETGGKSMYDFRPGNSPLILVLGSEELGIHPELLQSIDTRLSIPLYGPKASLNVGVAAGAALCSLDMLMRESLSMNG